MISIITAENKELLESYHKTHSHYDVLWFPESNCHVNTEAKRIIEFVQENKESPHIEIYTLRETTVNIIGTMIAHKMITNEDVTVKVLPENRVCWYDEIGYLKDWIYDFYLWDLELFKA
jgi:hypothetical protein